jgi:hypothetical protein
MVADLPDTASRHRRGGSRPFYGYSLAEAEPIGRVGLVAKDRSDLPDRLRLREVAGRDQILERL